MAPTRETVVDNGCKRSALSIPSTCVPLVLNTSVVHCSCLLARAFFANTTLHPGLPTSFDQKI